MDAGGSNCGSLVSTKSPHYVNQLGFDANLIAADGLIANGATSATINMKTGGETYYPGVVTTAIELFAPSRRSISPRSQGPAAGVNGGSRVETYSGVRKIPDAAFAAFGGANGKRADVWTASLSESFIDSVQGQFGKTPGIALNTAPSGGTSSTLPGSLSAQPPLRIGTLRRLPPLPG